MPDQAILQKIQSAGALPSPLKAALLALLPDLDPVLSGLEGLPFHRARYMLSQLVKEAIDPDQKTLFWPLALDLLTTDARGLGEAGQPALASLECLKPLMADRLGWDDTVSLQPVTPETLFGVCFLSDTLPKPYNNFVAPNVFSLAEAAINPHAWFRAIYAGRVAVGFMMMEDKPEEAHYFLWRLMIGGPFRGRGYGRQAVEQLMEVVRTRPGATQLLVSCG
jgi:hypothetical protein